MVEKMSHVSSKNLLNASIPNNPINLYLTVVTYLVFVIYMTFLYFYCSLQLLDAVPEDGDQVVDSEETDYDIVDMDVSELADKFIETNVSQQNLPKMLLLPVLYEESLSDNYNLDDYLE